jgi:hypothetical protein
VPGRSKAYESIIKGEAIKKINIPESFNVLVRELKGLGLDVELMKDKERVDADDAARVMPLKLTRGEAPESALDEDGERSEVDKDIEEHAPKMGLDAEEPEEGNEA